MTADLFNAADIPFNLAGELIDNSTTAEGEARVRALAESEAKKAQMTMDLETLAHVPTDLPMSDEEMYALDRTMRAEKRGELKTTPTAAWIETPLACYLVGKL